MPLLDDAQVQELLEAARIEEPCEDCGSIDALDYCRTCDEFYSLHARHCYLYSDRHNGHRLTIVPFVEDKSR